ncbi:hypothetical protein SAMN06272775_4647 [Streptomyces sp. 2323.1]|uniref:hypothetical protein n=1 Tax=Streptomyces sp. 2323.1 TaxID=1938841 RepID=UPI000BBF582D|nr:hypothetical protein [Streptomyces sp. 2323.1]SOE13671.1 hypothetical protein SAMN06272775_4647 [Streptomyces sp. 2323.1]
MSAVTMSDLAMPLHVLRLLAWDFPGLPAMDVQVSPIFPNELELASYGDFGAFEAWREALGIRPESVTYREQTAGRTRVLRAAVDVDGVRVCLIGFSAVVSFQDTALTAAGGAR